MLQVYNLKQEEGRGGLLWQTELDDAKTMDIVWQVSHTILNFIVFKYVNKSYIESISENDPVQQFKQLEFGNNPL